MNPQLRVFKSLCCRFLRRCSLFFQILIPKAWFRMQKARTSTMKVWWCRHHLQILLGRIFLDLSLWFWFFLRDWCVMTWKTIATKMSVESPIEIALTVMLETFSWLRGFHEPQHQLSQKTQGAWREARVPPCTVPRKLGETNPLVRPIPVQRIP